MERLIRFGIWGTGWIAQQLAADFSLAAGAVLHAVASRTAGRAKAFAATYKVANAYEGLDALLADPQVDVVYIASPNYRHAAECLLAIEGGKAVLCEKPFAIDEQEAQSVVQAARERGVFCMEAMWTRFLPAVVEAKRIISEGELGNIGLLQGNFAGALSDESKSQFAAPRLGGGALLDRGVYLVSLAQHFLGEPDRVQALATLSAVGADVSSTMQLQWRSGALADFSASLRWNGTDEMMIFADRGRLRLHQPFYRPHRIEVKHDRIADKRPSSQAPAEAAITRPRLPPAAMLLRRRLDPVIAYLRRGAARNFLFSGNGYQFELLEVVRCLRQGRTESPVMPLDDSLAVLRTMDALRLQWTAGE